MMLNGMEIGQIGNFFRNFFFFNYFYFFRSQFWNMVDRNTKEKLELKIENDGEFWMSFEDWLRNFDNCQICNLTPDTINDISEKDWENSRLLSVCSW